jgi:hypothetical protein
LLLKELSAKSPDELRIVMIDPSVDSLSEFDGLPHLLEPICYEAMAHDALARLCGEMQRRINGHSIEPPILVVVDRWVPKQNIECPGLLDELLANGESNGIYVWLSLDDPETIPEELRDRMNSFVADGNSFDFDDDIYDKCLGFAKNNLH